MVAGVVSTLTTNLDAGIVKVLELIGDLSNVLEVGFKSEEVRKVIGTFSLLPGVGEAVLGVLRGHPVMPLDRGELLRPVRAASALGKSSLEVDVAVDEVPVAPREGLSIHRRLRSPSSCIGGVWG